jgi:hypothetical protein|tara:strand:+ start:53 stop:241 length:189 start_codon:yes stop_codon:yes gene_type:complete
LTNFLILNKILKVWNIIADLQIPEELCQQGDLKGKISHIDGENFHYIGVTEELMVQHFQTRM